MNEQVVLRTEAIAALEDARHDGVAEDRGALVPGREHVGQVVDDLAVRRPRVSIQTPALVSGTWSGGKFDPT